MLFGIPGTESINIDLSKILSGVGQFVLIIILMIVVGAIFYFWYYLKQQKKKFNQKLFWFEEVNGQIVPIGEDMACELIIPNTNIAVFYIKEKDLYLPRPVKRMGKNAYWYVIKNNREIVNFTLKNINEEMKEANLDYDHTDQRYALTTLRELIKRNYRDKSQPWWREYKEIISLVILIFVLTLSVIFIMSKVGGLIDKVGILIDKVGILIDNADQIIKSASAIKGSGVMAA